MRIAVGQSATDYLLQPMRSDFGRAFRLVKLLGDHDGYNVCLNSRFSLCDCRGFHSAKSGECKHVAGLKALVAAGKL
ncbi:MAG TPA: hypothetical protein VMS17_31560 [Gemmataceae bacterium]|nr:hypothetical protein [Gemmataceae bacterium]